MQENTTGKRIRSSLIFFNFASISQGDFREHRSRSFIILLKNRSQMSTGIKGHMFISTESYKGDQEMFFRNKNTKYQLQTNTKHF